MHWWLMCPIIFVLTLIYCEWLADYVVIYNCNWPKLKIDADKQGPNDPLPLRAMIIADIHLLGPHRGHWLDKLYREWHMAGAFKAAATMLKPEVVFVLGDLFDEGDMVSDKQFSLYVQRFVKLFQLPTGVPLISVAGNHDIGFHYKMHPYFTDRFQAYLNYTGIHLYSLKRNHFVLINSMAMENDGCYFCANAKKSLNEISEKLECMQYPEREQCQRKHKEFYSKPILLQHFPTYRASDAECEVHDAPEIEAYREAYHVLSIDATEMLGKLKPRLAFAGHSHNYCYSINRLGIEEYTVASFSWRNKVNPSFMLATITPDAYEVSKCEMLAQPLVYGSYLMAFISIVLFTLYHIYYGYSTIKAKVA